jgi:hypothetical protein
MNRLARRARAAVTIAALTFGAVTAAAPFASAAPSFKVPFTDEYAHGLLTFCNKSNQPVTSGSLDAVPFSWKTVSSAEPPAGYRNSSGRVTLYAYQPLEYVDPGDWSGSQLTAASVFSNPSHPVAQATPADSPLLYFVQNYPPHWDGLVEIRMMYTAVNQEQLTTPYAMAVLRITGNTWTVVEGGNTPCSAGKGVSVETVMLPKRDLKQQSVVAASTKKSPAPGASSSAGAAGGNGQSTGGSQAGGSGGLAADTSSAGGLSAGALVGIGLGVLALIWGAIVAIGRWRRRTASAE